MSTAPLQGASSRVELLRAEDIPLARRVQAFVYLMAAEFFYGWSWNTIDVLRPQIRAALDLSLTQVGSGYTAQSLGAMIGAICFGQVADHIGRRRTLVAVIAGYGLAAGAGAIVASYPAFLLQRLTLGIFLGGVFPVLIGIYMSLFASSLRGKLAAIGSGTYNLAVVALGAALSLQAAVDDWRLILWAGAIPPLVLAPLALVAIPDDRRLLAWGAAAASPTLPRFPIVELFKGPLRRITLLLFALKGLNFFAYQAYAGWVSTYIVSTLGFSAAVAGRVIAWQFSGALIGGFFWGWLSDRTGRKPVAAGFATCVPLVIGILTIFNNPDSLSWAGFGFGFMTSCAVAWAPWISELYPAHLRSTAMSIYHWGRIISMTAPLITGAIAARFGLQTAMMLAAVAYALAVIVWVALPETHGRKVRV